ncbi:MAG: lytic transglycosylase domain-containing protein [Alphaproteobacteria bacterium]|nr:lytic transglycosylase domain-containing protein [Alphaproteobacteria bacterium]
MKHRAALLISAFCAGALVARAQETLPPGLVRQGGVIMMQPIYEGGERTEFLNNEHRPGNVHVLNPASRDIVVRAFEAADRNNWSDATALAAEGHDETVRDLIAWRRLLDRNSGASFAEIDAFIKSHADWPLRDSLYSRAEAAIPSATAPAAILTWFGNRAAASALGKIRLGEAQVATGKPEGRELIRAGWRDGSFDRDQEQAILAKDFSFLTAEDQRDRLDALLWRDEIGAAKRQLARVSPVEAQIGEARIALKEGGSRADAVLERLPGTAREDPGLVFDRARAARRAGKHDEAQNLLLSIPRAIGARHPEKWWPEFNAEARQAMEDRNFRRAYVVASRTGLSAGDEYAESEFLSGWIALRFLKDPDTALEHFQRLDAAVARPISKARAAYWQGRSYEDMGKMTLAQRQYETAAKSPETFYGQIALAHISQQPVLHLVDAPVAPSPSDAFEKEALTRPMAVLAEVGEESLLRDFAARDLEAFPAPEHAKLLMQRLTAWGFREIALRLAKTESYAGILMLDYAFPVIPLSSYPGPGPAPEPALVLALIRQETEFDPDSVSAPGARGLMQLMPESAEKAAREANLPYRPGDLLRDTAYNIQLGMTELASYLGEWGGSYILATASYNAGVHNASKWMGYFGDPRNGTDAIDWIEAIPFSETRNYVERVLENTQIYRNRLAGKDTSLMIMSDLNRRNVPGEVPWGPPRAELAPGSPQPAKAAAANEPVRHRR